MQTKERSIWLIRHGNRLDFADPDWAKANDYPVDPPLSADGVLQAQATAAFLSGQPIRHLFASPFRRTMETASWIAEALGLPVCIEEGLREMLLIEWFPQLPKIDSDETLAKRFARVDTTYEDRCIPVWPETKEDSRARGARTITRLAADFQGDLALVTHGGMIQNLCQGLLPGEDLKLHTCMCCLIELRQSGNQWRLHRSGHDTSHLPSTEETIRVV